VISIWEKEALDRTLWRSRFRRGYGPVVRQTTEWINEVFEVFALLRCYTALIVSRRFGTGFSVVFPRLKQSEKNSFWTAWPLKMDPISCPETSVTNYQSTLPNFPGGKDLTYTAARKPDITQDKHFLVRTLYNVVKIIKNSRHFEEIRATGHYREHNSGHRSHQFVYVFTWCVRDTEGCTCHRNTIQVTEFINLCTYSLDVSETQRAAPATETQFSDTDKYICL
jgi:hypothetical protein